LFVKQKPCPLTKREPRMQIEGYRIQKEFQNIQDKKMPSFLGEGVVEN